MSANVNANASVRFTIDFANKTIIGTQASFKKAGKGFGPEYDELTAKMNALPGYTMKVKAPKKKSNKTKETYNGLTYEIMKAHIENKGDDARLEEMKKIREVAKATGHSAYPIVKKWFLDLYKSDFQTAENKKFNAGKVATQSVIRKVKAKTVKAVDATAQTSAPLETLKKSA